MKADHTNAKTELLSHDELVNRLEYIPSQMKRVLEVPAGDNVLEAQKVSCHDEDPVERTSSYTEPSGKATSNRLGSRRTTSSKDNAFATTGKDPKCPKKQNVGNSK